uniref:HTH_Tnp_Tc3_1 domain-containing protein n=1 Tax=Heterorhabditis bacteriophora TaxID=37862 RepID=A0A1I7WBP1_HETBA
MACGPLLNDIEKGEILAFFDSGLNRTEIARKIGPSRNVVANFLGVPDEYGIKNKTHSNSINLRPIAISDRGIISMAKTDLGNTLAVSRWLTK